jgi:hypothetical protein
VTHKHVESVLGRLATDAALRLRFLENAIAVLEDLRAQGAELSDTEFDALARTNADAIQSFARTLDRRIRKTSLG